MSQNDFAGTGQFVWWIGFVENRNDPLKLGRVKVRCVGWHADNKMQLPTDALPWAQLSLPTNGVNTYSPKEGEMVFGFFMDGPMAQDPIVLGVFPSIPLKAANIQEAFSDPRTAAQLATAPRAPESKTYNTDGTGIEITEKSQAINYPLNLDEPTTSRLARNDSDTITKTFIQERKENKVTDVPTATSTWNEPETKYGSVYPYNNVMETESGHIVEYDDTPGKERIQIAHRNGSFTEWYPDGDKVEKITKDKYSIVMKDDNVYIMGDCNITVQGNAEVYVQKNANVKIDGNVEVQVGGNYNEIVSGSYTLRSEGNMKIDAPNINLNSGTQGAARIGDTADTGDAGNAVGSNKIESGSSTVIIGG
jgi:hypothetical protein